MRFIIVGAGEVNSILPGFVAIIVGAHKQYLSLVF